MLNFWPAIILKLTLVWAIEWRFILREFVIAQIPITAYQEPRLHDKTQGRSNYVIVCQWVEDPLYNTFNTQANLFVSYAHHK